MGVVRCFDHRRSVNYSKKKQKESCVLLFTPFESTIETRADNNGTAEFFFCQKKKKKKFEIELNLPRLASRKSDIGNASVVLNSCNAFIFFKKQTSIWSEKWNKKKIGKTSKIASLPTASPFGIEWSLLLLLMSIIEIEVDEPDWIGSLTWRSVSISAVASRSRMPPLQFAKFVRLRKNHSLNLTTVFGDTTEQSSRDFQRFRLIADRSQCYNRR